MDSHLRGRDPRIQPAMSPPFSYDQVQSDMGDRGMLLPEGGQRTMGQEGKIFVGGLNWITTTDSLRAHFERFGVIADCVIMKDRNTQQPRGFGFVTFIDPMVAIEVASLKQVMVDGRNVEVKRAVPRGDDDNSRQPRPPGASPSLSSIAAPSAPGQLGVRPLPTVVLKRVPGGGMSTKIFVGGISWSTTDDEFLKHFERYGPVAAAHVMKYRDGTPRGFGYVTFMADESVDRACNSRNNIGGREVDVKRAVSKEEMELVKTHDSPAVITGAPAALAVHPLVSQANFIASVAAAARAGGGLEAHMDPNRALQELLVLQQQQLAGLTAGGGGGGTAVGVAELLSQLNMAHAVGSQSPPAVGGADATQAALIHELLRQQALIGNLRQQQQQQQQQQHQKQIPGQGNLIAQLQHQAMQGGQVHAQLLQGPAGRSYLNPVNNNMGLGLHGFPAQGSPGITSVKPPSGLSQSAPSGAMHMTARHDVGSRGGGSPCGAEDGEEDPLALAVESALRLVDDGPPNERISRHASMPIGISSSGQQQWGGSGGGLSHLAFSMDETGSAISTSFQERRGILSGLDPVFRPEEEGNANQKQKFSASLDGLPRGGW